MECLGLEPGVAGWKAEMNPLSYGCTPTNPVRPSTTQRAPCFEKHFRFLTFRRF